MKIKATYVLAAMALASTTIGLQSCSLKKMLKMAKDQKLTLNPDPLELHGDSVKFDMAVNLPVKMLRKNKIYSVATVYKYADQQVILGDVILKERDFPTSGTESPRLNRKFAFAYTSPLMDKGQLYIQGIASTINGTQKSIPQMPMPDKMGMGLITTSRLVQDVYPPAYAGHGYIPGEELTPTTVEFFFEQNSDKLRTTETKGTQGLFLDNFVASKNATKTVVVTGSHSPEGTEARNTVLAESRARVVELYYKSVMKRFNYKKDAANAVEFVTRSQVQTWKSFADTLETYTGIPEDQKKAMVDLVTKSTANFLDTEKQLSALPGYDKVFAEVYPRLRTATTEILTQMPKKSDAEIALLAQKIVARKVRANSLSDKELSYAATMTPILAEKEAIYLAATKKTDSWQSHNNLAAVYIEMAAKQKGLDRKALAEKALVQAKIAKIKNNSAEPSINIAVANLLLGNNGDAAKTLAESKSLNPGPDARKVLNSLAGITYIRVANYDEATRVLADAISTAPVNFNKGLTQLLRRNYDAAAAAFLESVAADNGYALSYYCLAIVAARQKNEDALGTNLLKAVQADDKLKARAVNDLEFMRYYDNPKFKAALK